MAQVLSLCIKEILKTIFLEELTFRILSDPREMCLTQHSESMDTWHLKLALTARPGLDFSDCVTGSWDACSIRAGVLLKHLQNP